MINDSLTRRSLLKGAGSLAVISATLGGADRRAPAQGMAPQRVVVMNNQGNMMDSWVPAREGALGTLGPTLAPLQVWRDRITLVSGVDNAAGLLCDRSDSHERGRTTLIADVFAENINRRGQVKSSDQVSNGSFATPSFEQVLGRRLRTRDQFGIVPGSCRGTM